MGRSAWDAVDPMNPTTALAGLQKAGLVGAEQPVDLPEVPETCPAGHLRVVIISDTHTHEPPVPNGDVLIHAGDFSDTGEAADVEKFVAWMKRLPHRHKILVAGNHDLTMDEASYPKLWKVFRHPEQYDTKALRRMVSGEVRMLEEEGVEIEGVRIWGSPWQPWFCDWAFNLERGPELEKRWQKIPDDVDILVTHSPPLGHGDLCSSRQRAGCFHLLREVTQRVRPRLHIFGHIHEGYGATTDGHTVFVNASTCTLDYRPHNKPIVMDVPIRGPAEAAGAAGAAPPREWPGQCVCGQCVCA
eukprot:TRINITY_DN15788_c0_g1_i1.p1 TRINITY_DN15788_c0_g1~~TRINITY_DN15788_c0_g1_i1.p1  ORF type:complete len:301 (+),score=70.93 TRINITY_DN15788_c0_g1_i1:67-969(+)